MGKVVSAGANLRELTDPTDILESFDWKGISRNQDSGGNNPYLTDKDVVYLCHGIEFSDGSIFFAASDEPCNPNKQPVGLIAAAKLIFAEKEEFPATMITPFSNVQ